MLPRFANIFQQGNSWLNWLEKQPEGSVRPVVIESVTKIMACGTTLMGYTVVLFITGLLPHKEGLLPV
ncbi:IS91 transposase [Escherichia coli]|nr:IS91 transposase [Escherichia coli]GDB08502.1 IS91 transposase [Escherichia coli]